MTIQHLPKCFIALLFAFALVQHANADPAPAPQPAITLAQVLPAMQPPVQGVALVVRAQQTVLPGDSAAPPPGASLAECADAFDLTTHEFGTVIAVAPASMTVFNNHPDPPDLSDILTPSDAFKQLAASLSDSQWAKLTSAGGIGPHDLDSSQQALFWAIFPRRTLRIAPETAPDSNGERLIQPTDLTAALPSAHIRLAQRVVLHAPRQKGGSMEMSDLPAPGAPLKWMVANQNVGPFNVDDNQARAEIPNSPKPGELKFDQKALKTSVSLAGIKTVGDLVFRIGRTVNIELYADRHYEAWPVTFVGPAQTASAGDLLQALEFCVAGTYRAVGPAYVLTDNLTGMGALRQIWADREASVQMMQAQERIATQDTLYSRRQNATISTFGDPLAQSKYEAALNATDPAHLFHPWSAWIKGIPFAELTSSQQDAARRMAEENPSAAVNLNGKWQVEPKIVAQLIAPGFAQPIAMPDIVAGTLLWPPPDKMAESNEALHASLAAQKAAAGLAPPHLADLLKQTAHRAVLAAPRSASEAKTVVAAMQKFGLNELWLDIFSGGKAHIPNTPFPQPLDEKDDVLAAALKATKGTGIAVFPVVDLLKWGPAPTDETRDLDVLGENSVQLAKGALAQSAALVNQVDPQIPAAGMWVSPFSHTVGDDLAALISALAKYPAINGLVWRWTTPPGYSGADRAMGFGSIVVTNNASGHLVMRWSMTRDFGYTQAARLAFLRAFHADPLDIPSNASPQANLSLPAWDSSKINSEEVSEWGKFRQGADNHLLRRLLQAAQFAAPAGKILPLFQQDNTLESSTASNYYGGPIPPGPWPASGDLPDPKPALLIATVAVKPKDTADDLAKQLSLIVTSKSCNGFALDLLPGDDCAGVAGLENLAGTDGAAEGVSLEKEKAPSAASPLPAH